MKPFTTIAAVFFGLVALAHAIRLYHPFRIMIAGEYLPRWLSAIGLVVSGVLCYGLWRESRKA
jgi:hypothetical protein